MKKFKKGISLLAVIAFLITALVPLGAMAAPSAQVTNPPEPGGTQAPTPTPAPSSAQVVYGRADAADTGAAVPSTAFSSTGSGAGPEVTNIRTVYAWAGSNITLNAAGIPSTAVGVQWIGGYTRAAWTPINTTNTTTAGKTDAAVNTALASAASVPGVRESDGTSSYTYHVPDTKAGNGAYYAAVYYQQNSQNFWSSVVFEIVPVIAGVDLTATTAAGTTVKAGDTSTTEPLELTWSEAATLKTEWTVQRVGGTAGVPEGDPITTTSVPSRSNLRVQAYTGFTGALVSATEFGRDETGEVVSTDDAPLFTISGLYFTESLSASAPASEYRLIGQGRTDIAQSTLVAGGDNAALAPLQYWTNSATMYVRIVPETVYDVTKGVEQSDLPNGLSIPAVKGQVTAVKAERPNRDASGIWLINGNYYSEYNTTANIDAPNPANPLAVWVDDSDSPETVTAQDGSTKSVYTSTLYIVMPTNSNAQIDAVYQAGVSTTQQVPANWPAGANAIIFGTNRITYHFIPADQTPDLEEILVSPTGTVAAKGQLASFRLALAPNSGLRIMPNSVTVEVNTDPNDPLKTVQLPVSLVNDEYRVDTTQMPVGTYPMTFSAYVENAQNPNATYPMKGTAEITILQLQGQIANADRRSGNTSVGVIGAQAVARNQGPWLSTVSISAASNQVLDLNNEWLSAAPALSPTYGFSDNPPSDVAGYVWLNETVGSNAIQNLSSVNALDTQFTVPNGTTSATWSVVCQPVDAAGVPVGQTVAGKAYTNVAVIYNITRTTAAPAPVLTGYTYSVTPAGNVAVSGTSQAWNVTGNVPTGSTNTVLQGSTVYISPQLSVLNNPDDMNYQWMVRSGSEWVKLMDAPNTIQGVNSRVVTITASEATKDLQLYCIVTNRNATAATYEVNNPAQNITLKVLTPGAVNTQAAPLPMITSNPATTSNPVQNPSNLTTVTVSTGMTVTFTAQDMNRTDGAPAPLPSDILQYQWQSAPSATGTFTNIEGATGSTYTVTATQENSGTVYRVHVVNPLSAGMKTGDSNRIRMTVEAPSGRVWFTEPATTPNPYNVRPGATVTLKAAAKSDNGDEVKYQWQVARVSADTTIDQVLSGAWTNVTGATGAELTTGALANGYYFYRCIATNAVNAGKTATSLPFRVNVRALSNIPTVIPAHFKTGQEVNYVPIGAEAGSSVTFGVTATVETGEDLVYTWKIAAPTESAAGLTFNDPTSAANSTILAAGADGNLTMNMPESYNGYSLVCQVSNANDPQAYAYSAVWNITVWPEGTVPKILAEPSNITATYPNAYSTTQSEDRQTETIVSLPMPNMPAGTKVDGTVNPPTGIGTSWVLQKLTDGIWTDLTNDPQEVVIKLPSVANNPSSAPAKPTVSEDNSSVAFTAEAILSNDAYLANGEYRFAITGYAPGNGWKPTLGVSGMPNATVYTDPFTVEITVIGQPVVTQQPVSQRVTVGESASFTIEAKVEPATTQLTYRWQKSTDSGATWTNCLDSDGTGAGTPTFTTVPATVAMQNEGPIQYRCIVQNLNTQQNATSSAAALWIEDAPEAAEPTISIADGAQNIEIREIDGVRYLVGTALTVTKDGTPVSAVKAMLTSAPEGYALKVVDAAGAEKADTDIIATDDRIELVKDSTGQAVDTLTIVVIGDVMGNGQMSLTQLVQLSEAYRGARTLDGAKLLAGDFTGSGSISLTDLVREATIYKQEIMGSDEPIPAPSDEPTASPSASAEPSDDPSATPSESTSAEPSASASPEA